MTITEQRPAPAEHDVLDHRWPPRQRTATSPLPSRAVVLGALSWLPDGIAELGSLDRRDARCVLHRHLRLPRRIVEGRRQALDRLMSAIVTSCFLIVAMPLVSLVWTVVERGMNRFDSAFFTETMRGVVGEGGGAYHAIIGTLIITGLATLMSVPFGLFTAIYLAEYGHGTKLAKAIQSMVDVMTGIPSIVAGLFAYALFELVFGPGTRSGIAGAVALTVLMTPVVVRSAEEMLRLVPDELREASYALGVPKWKTIVKVVLPTAIAGIITGIVLAIARVIGETAPLLDHRRTRPGRQLEPVRRSHDDAAGVHLLPVRAARPAARGRSGPGVDRCAHADDHRGRAVLACSYPVHSSQAEGPEMTMSEQQATIRTTGEEFSDMTDRLDTPTDTAVESTPNDLPTGPDNRIVVEHLNIYYGTSSR